MITDEQAFEDWWQKEGINISTSKHLKALAKEAFLSGIKYEDERQSDGKGWE